MGRSNQLNTLLVEIMIAVLFFALSSTVVLQTFVVTRNQSRLAGVYDEALMEAQNIADQLYVSDHVAETLRKAGFRQDEYGWTLQEELYDLRVMLSEEKTAAGKLVNAKISVVHNENPLLTLPCTRYIPGEVQP